MEARCRSRGLISNKKTTISSKLTARAQAQPACRTRKRISTQPPAQNNKKNPTRGSVYLFSNTKLCLVRISSSGYWRIQLLICSHLERKKEKISWGHELACVCSGRETPLFKCWLSQERPYSKARVRTCLFVLRPIREPLSDNRQQ